MTTREAYYALEAESEMKHEYVGGDVIAMSGGSRNHAVIMDNINALFRAHVRGRGCMNFIAEMNVLARNENYYPDVVVVCGEEAYVEDAPIAVLRNPTVVVEVLSPTTAGRDRTEKLDNYLAIPSLKQVLFVWQDAPRVDVVSRESGAAWGVRRTDGFDASAHIPALDLDLPLAEVYRDVTW